MFQFPSSKSDDYNDNDGNDDDDGDTIDGDDSSMDINERLPESDEEKSDENEGENPKPYKTHDYINNIWDWIQAQFEK